MALASGTAYDSTIKNDTIGISGVPIGFNRTPSTSTPDPAPATAALTQFTGAVEAGTGAVTDNTGSTETNTDSKNKEKTLAEKMADMYDWVAVRLEYFGDKTKAIADRITDYISDTRKTYLLDKQMKATQNEIGANFTGARYYKEQADKVATDTEMSDDLVRKARTGAWQFEELSEEDEDKVKAYLKYYDGYKEAIEKTRELKAAQQELFEQWANMPTETAEKKVEKLTNRIENLQGAYSVASSGASGLNTYNKVVNAQLISAQKNVRKAQKRENKAVDRATKALNKYTNATDDLKNYGNLLTKNVGKKNSIPDSIKSKISEAVASDTRISLSSSEIKKLPSSIKNQIDKYNKKLANEQNLGNVASSVADYAQNARAETKNTKSRVKDIKKNQTNVQKAAAKYANNVSYKGQNALLDAQVKDQKKIVNTYNSALKKTQDNVEKAAKKADTTAKKAENAKNVLKSTGDNLLGNFGKDLTSKQKKAVKSGKMVDTKGLTGETLEAVKEYNAAVTKSQNANAKASNASVNYNTALKAQETATQNLTAAQTEYAQMIIDNEKQKFDNVKNYYEAQINYQNALTESYAKDRQLKEKQGKDTTTKDYKKEINGIGEQRKLLVKEQNDLRKQLADSVASGIIKKGSEEWNNMQTEIVNVGNSIDDLDMQVLDLQDEMRNEVFYRSLNKALEEAEKLRDTLSTIGDIISEDMMFDKDGNITDLGIASLAMNIKDYESNLGTLQTLLNKRNEMIKNFNNGNNDTNYSQKEFDEDMKGITGEIQNVLKNASTTRTAILSMVEKTAKAELDATMKVIDARKELLAKQKE